MGKEEKSREQRTIGENRRGKKIEDVLTANEMQRRKIQRSNEMKKSGID